MSTSVSIVLPVRDGGPHFDHLRRHLAAVRARHEVDVLVIDSGSTDGTDDRAEEAGFRVHRIPPEEFGHGRTRNLGVRLAEGEVVCFVTHDVLPVTLDWPLRFADALGHDDALAGIYGRQVPRDATTMEMFFVSLNYPGHALRFDPGADGHHPRPGRVLFSNAFSAVRRRIALEVPLPEDALYSEDQIWAHRALQAGWSIAYDPSVEALHAHVYSLKGLFRRSYSVGRALRNVGIDGGASWRESAAFLTEEIRYFIRQGHIHRLPQLLPYEFLRWAGFQVGRSGLTLWEGTRGWWAGEGARG